MARAYILPVAVAVMLISAGLAAQTPPEGSDKPKDPAKAPQPPAAPERGAPQTPPAGTEPQPPVSTSPDQKLALEPLLPPEEAIRQVREAFDRIDQGGDLQKEAPEINRLSRMIAETAKDNPWLMYIRGRSAIFSGRVVDGIQDLDAFSKTTPGRNHWKTFRILGDVHLKDYPRLAEARYRQALSVNDREPTILLGLSQALYRMGQRNEALELAERAVQLDGGKTVTYLDNQAAMLRLEGQNDRAQLQKAAMVVNRAIQIVQDALKERPTDPSLLRLLAAEYESALVVLRDILNQTPDNADAYADVAVISENLGELRRQLLMHEAIVLIETQALPRLEGKATERLALNYARLLEQVGRIGAAREVYEKTLEGEPTSAEAKAALERLNQQYPPTPSESEPPSRDPTPPTDKPEGGAAGPPPTPKRQ